MGESIWASYILKYFGGLSKKYYETWNNKLTQPELMFKTMTTDEFSVDGTWDSAEIKNSVVAADIVSTNSSLPLKKRDSFGFVKGKLPKLGMEKKKNEDDIERINLMKAKGTTENAIVNAIFGDLKSCAYGVDVRLEMMFEEALSTGVCEIDNNENNGTAIRADFGYKTENQLFGSKVWGASGYTPITDIKKMFDRANDQGTKILFLYMTPATLMQIRTSAEGKALYCNYASLTVQSGIVPNKTRMIEALEDEFSCKIKLVDNKFNVEKNGVQTPITPWAAGRIVGTQSDKVGRIIYAQLAEETNKVSGVEYQKATPYTLLSMYRETNPLYETTASQAKAIPVIDGGAYIITLDTTKTA